MQRKFDMQGYRDRLSVDFIFILALLCVFAFGSLMSVILGSNAYKDINADMTSNFEFRTPLSYIASKVRQGDAVNAVRIVQKDGVEALVLSTDDGGVPCETWIYEYDDHLYEVYITKDTAFALADGIEMIPSYGLDFETAGKLLHITAGDAAGKMHTLTLSFRTTQGGVF